MAKTDFDIGIVGGGLGGLSLSILLARQGFQVALFEKEKYPFHRVCGEYISNESYPFLQHLGVNLQDSPQISRLQVTSLKGKVLKAQLPLGGFGISRYQLDHQLAQLAIEAGVQLFDGTRVDSVKYIQENDFHLKTRGGEFHARLVVSAHGKKSNLDRKLDRAFARRKLSPANNYVGIKYHVHHPDFPSDLIELSNFRGGYCGMSQIEDGKFCMCYLTTAASLQAHGNSIPELEAQVLSENPVLAERLARSERIFEEAVTVSNVNFQVKSAVENHILMLGDAAGSIAPLAGNGMSMSLHAAWLVQAPIASYLQGQLTAEEMESAYSKRWRRLFKSRIKAGTQLQKLFGKTFLTEMAIGGLRYLPFVTRPLIRLTHGKVFFHK